MSDSIYVALADPTRSLYDKTSGFKIMHNLVKEVSTNPWPSNRVREWVQSGALKEVQATDVQFFYTKTELNQKKKDELVSIASDWDISETDDEGKDKTRAQLIEEIGAKLGDD